MWMKHSTEFMPPPWAPTGTDCAQFISGGCICRTHDLPGDPRGDQWVDAGDGWKVAFMPDEVPAWRQVVDLGNGSVVRMQDGSHVGFLVVLDGQGREWPAPIVLRPDGASMLPLKIVRGEDGLPERRPSEFQARLLKAGHYFRELLEADGDQIECDVSAASELLAACLHLPAEAVFGCGFLDDMLITRIWLASLGQSAED